MLSYTCAACGKSITDAALQQGTAVRHGSRLYCASCAALIVTPDTLPAIPDQNPEPKPELEVLAEFKISIHAPDVLSPFAVPQHEIDPKGVVAADVELIEGANPDMAHAHDDDDWFKPRGSGVATADGSAPRLKPAAPAPVPAAAAAPVKSALKPGSKPNLIPAKPVAKSSGISSRAGAPAAVPAPAARKSAAPSARMASVAPPKPEAQAESEPEAVTPAPVQARKSGRSSAIKPAAASPSRGGSSRRMSAVRAPAVEAAPAPVEETVDASEPESEDVTVTSPSKGKSSRRMLAAKGSARSGASRSRRDEREEKDSKKDKDKKSKGKSDDKMPLYIGIGVVAVLLIGAFVVMGRGKDDGDTAKKAIPVEVDKTPSGTYAREAEKALSSGTRSKAVEFYNKAAAQAEREGNTTQARNYGMKAMNLIKSSKLSDH